jgi:endonuclease III-like uncharacterized protein
VEDWKTLVRVVLEAGRLPRKPRDWSWISETPLGNPDETCLYSVAGLAEVLEAADQRAAKAPLLHALAEWWERRIGDVSNATGAFTTRSVKSWQDDLRAIPGVNWELADRILLFVGGCTVYPLDRGSMRITARHGWMEISSDYDDWQSFFTTAAKETAFDLGQLSRWNSAVARDFCKAQPHCDDCPLKSLLPARGIVSLEERE